MPIRKILLVDDSKTELHHLSELLSKRGFAVRTAENGEEAMRRLPVIMCTSKNQETDRVWGMRQGARDYIVKPVDATELVAKIRAFD